MNEPRSDFSDAESHDGWHTSRLPGGATVHARVTRLHQRAVIDELYVHGTEINSEVLRSINMTKIRASIEGQGNTDATRHQQPEPARPEPTLADLRGRTPPSVESRRVSLSRHIEPLTRPAGQDPEDFYQRVAEAYRLYAATRGRAASAAIAAEANVPVTTAHRWVREARRRGFLPPGVRGKTG